MVADMAAILRIAEALDRSHRQVVKSVKMNVATMRPGMDRRHVMLAIETKPNENYLSEKWALGEKKWFFEKQFDVWLDLPVEAELVQTTSTS